MTARVMWCSRTGCDTKVILAHPVGRSSETRVYEAQDREPFATASTGCDVIMSGEAWRPGDLIEHFLVRFATTTETARSMVAGYPWHRRHGHDPEDSTGPAVEAGPVDLSEDARDITHLVAAGLAEVSGRHGADVASAISRALNRAGLRVVQTRGAWLVGHVAVAVCAGRTPVQVAEDITRHDVVREVLVIAPTTAPAPPPVVAGRPVVVLPTPAGGAR